MRDVISWALVTLAAIYLIREFGALVRRRRSRPQLPTDVDRAAAQESDVEMAALRKRGPTDPEAAREFVVRTQQLLEKVRAFNHGDRHTEGLIRDLEEELRVANAWHRPRAV